MSKARQQALANHAVELMSGFADVQSKAMFGGFGLFLDGLMFALIIEDRLYFKVDDESEPLFAALNLPRFTYVSAGRPGSLRYRAAPAEAYDDPGHMVLWARRGFDCALRQQQAKARKPRRSATLHDVAALPNLGPQSLALLTKVGLGSETALRRAGAVLAYARVKAAYPRTSLNLLWALEGALTGRNWKDVAEQDRASLLMALEDVQRHLV
ncbi:TfoX/Sxy family DNA transformation protein [Aquabacterium sp.]|uniref:TfoX/Sxy family DNA transformation protein n=1 Tax=Aquabacterium sp. TaxID=1872578 RepID=UPI0035B0592E